MLSHFFSSIRQCSQVLRLLFFMLSFFTSCSSFAIENDTAKETTENEEKQIFIEKANDELDIKNKKTEFSCQDISWMSKAEKEDCELHKKDVIEMFSKNYIHITKLQPFGDWDYYYVDSGTIDWHPNPGQKYKEVVVPAGFVTDLTSIPRAFWQVLRPEGRYAYAAVVHDYLYWVQNRTRDEADNILKFAMQDSKVDPKLIDVIYKAVRTFGKSAWDNNAKLKKAGERRFLSEFPEDFTISWSEWKKKPNVFDTTQE